MKVKTIVVCLLILILGIGIGVIIGKNYYKSSEESGVKVEIYEEPKEFFERRYDEQPTVMTSYKRYIQFHNDGKFERIDENDPAGNIYGTYYYNPDIKVIHVEYDYQGENWKSTWRWENKSNTTLITDLPFGTNKYINR